MSRSANDISSILNPKTTQIRVLPPIGGISRRLGYQRQQPFTVYDADNMFPLDVDTGRLTLATRPSLAPAIAPSSPVNMASRINGAVATKPSQSMVVAVDGQLYWWNGFAWIAATGDASSSVDTGRTVFARPFLQSAFVAQASGKPIVFDYVSGIAEVMAEVAGAAPEDCTIIEEWQESIWLAGKEDQPHIVFNCRTGNAFDWDFSAPIDDQFGAFFLAFGGPLTAIINLNADTALFSTTEGIRAMRGHPRRGGLPVPDLLSTTYILGNGAWTKTPDGTLYFMSPEGLMTMPPGQGSVPSSVSRDVLPDELIGLTLQDPRAPTINVSYESRWNGILITDRRVGFEQAWWFDLFASKFWRCTFDTGQYPYTSVQFPILQSEDVSGLLLGRVS